MNRALRLFLVVSCLVSHLCAVQSALAAPLLLTPKEGNEGNVKEFFSSNRDKRFLVRIHIWGDVPAPGVYYLPDNTTLLDALGYAGGATGVLSKTEIALSRMIERKEKGGSPQQQTVKLGGDELVDRPDYRDMVLRNGDVVHLDSPAKVDSFFRALTVTSTILGIVTAVLTIYLVTKK